MSMQRACSPPVAPEKFLRAEGLYNNQTNRQNNHGADKCQKNCQAGKRSEMNCGAETREDTRGETNHKDHGGNKHRLSHIPAGVVQRLQIMVPVVEL